MSKEMTAENLRKLLPAINTFLDRVQLQGSEALTLVHIKQVLNELPDRILKLETVSPKLEDKK